MAGFRAAASTGSVSACSRFGTLNSSGSGGFIRPSVRGEAVREARAAGFDNISLDLMMWLPQQSAADWRENVER